MKLTIEIWPNEQTKVPRSFTADEISIGRELSCDLTIANDVVSGEHARLTCQADQLLLADSFSTNGTFVNGDRISGSVALSIGDEIRFGVDGPRVVVVEFLADDSDQPAAHAQFSAEATSRPPRPEASVPAPKPVAVAPVSAVPSSPTPVRADAIGLSAAGDSESKPRDTRRPVSRGTTAFHVCAFSLTLLVTLGLSVTYLFYTSRQPSRGYTGLGLWLAIAGSIMFALVALYSLRKRAAQEKLPGRLQTWLRLHFWMSLAAFWMIFLHAGFHLDWGSGSWTLVLLAFVVFTGVGGWLIYRNIPSRVYGNVGNLAVKDVQHQIVKCEEEIEDAAAGRSIELIAYSQSVLSGRSVRAFDGTPKEAPVADEIEQLGQQRRELKKRVRSQRRLKVMLRAWLWLHVPASFVFVCLVFYHIYDAMEVEWTFKTAGPRDYASPESCAECHQQQYDEWIMSMHAIAQASPVTDLQNRLVLLKEAKDLKDGTISEPIVGNLCVRCHAPTGSLGDPANHEDPLIEITERAPASQFGVSCVTCHQIDQIHRNESPNDEDREDGIFFKNADNLAWTQGRLMLGPIGDEDEDELPSIGNPHHRGEFRDHFKDSKFCASCHTVVADDPQTGDRIVKLQNTYVEWLEGGENTAGKDTGDLNWSDLKFECLDCHGRKLDRVVREIEQMQVDRVLLSERRAKIVEILTKEKRVLPSDRLAAGPADKFDLPLPERRRYEHTFTGVDYHLEPGLPYPQGHPRFSENAAIQEKAVRKTQALLRMAAALRIESTLVSQSTATDLDVELLNLATGHHLPAGFSFAREMWIEVSISNRSESDPRAEAEDAWKIIIGGSHDASGRPDGKVLASTQRLNKRQFGLKNFQGVLFNSDEKREVVLQNETNGVLFGEAANAVRGGLSTADIVDGKQPRFLTFPDRQQFLLPGEIRPLTIRLPTSWNQFSTTSTARRLRVRLLFRNYPPEFLEDLARQFELNHNDGARATRCRNLINGLRIHEMAKDTIPLRFSSTTP